MQSFQFMASTRSLRKGNAGVNAVPYWRQCRGRPDPSQRTVLWQPPVTAGRTRLAGRRGAARLQYSLQQRDYTFLGSN